MAGLRLVVERARHQADAEVAHPGDDRGLPATSQPRPLAQTLDMIASAVDTPHSESRDLIGAAVMTLTDDGAGLPHDVPQGFGLPGMAERVRQAGGTFAVTSPGPPLGVVLRIRMPLHAPIVADESATPARPVRELAAARGGHMAVSSPVD